MQREQVTSSSVISIGYDESSRTLEVELHYGAVYQFHEVPRELYEEFLKAPSKGRFFAYQIKDRFEHSLV